MKSNSYDDLVIVDREYLQELEAFKKANSYMPDTQVEKLVYKDIVRIDTYKQSFINYLQQARKSVFYERALNVWRETELLWAYNAIWHLIGDISNIENTRATFELKKEEAKKRSKT